MKKLPALQFYTGDWRKDPCVQALDHEHKGVWIDLLCIMNETKERGRLVLPNGSPMPDDAIARNLGLAQAKWKQMRSNLLALGVASEDDDGVLYNRRIVRDEATRRKKAEAGRKGGKKSRPPKKKQTGSRGGSKSEVKGGSSSSSSSSLTNSAPREASAPEDVFGLLGKDTVLALKGLYGWPPDGTEGTDERVWPKDLPPDDRMRFMKIAVQRLEGESREYNGRLFRRILETVIDEQTGDTKRSPSRRSGPLFPEAEVSNEAGAA